MMKKNIFSRFMATLTDLVIALIPLLVWDLIIFIVLAGFLPASVMTFLDDVIRYVIYASFVITNPFITYVYGKTIRPNSPKFQGFCLNHQLHDKKSQFALHQF